MSALDGPAMVVWTRVLAALGVLVALVPALALGLVAWRAVGPRRGGLGT